MDTFDLTATELKNDTSAVINEVVFGLKEAIIKRHGKPVARIIPVIKLEAAGSKKELIKKYFGSIKKFPDVKKFRMFKRSDLTL